jgi:hypothetical protein
MDAKSSKISWGILVGATVVGFVAGAASVWMLFGEEWSYSLDFGTGSRADWVAAAGTWVIGCAAAYYARQAHMHRKDEVREQRTRSARGAKAWLTLADTSIINAKVIKPQVEAFLEEADSERPEVWHWDDLLKRVALNAKDVVLPSEVTDLLDEDAIREIARLNFALDAIRGTVARGQGYIADYKGDVNRKIDDTDMKVTRDILGFAMRAHENCTEFKKLVAVARRSL